MSKSVNAARNEVLAWVAGALLALAIASPGQEGRQSPPEPPPAPKPAAGESAWLEDDRGAYQQFGAALEAARPDAGQPSSGKAVPKTVTAAELAMRLDELNGKTLRVEATVLSTCPKKGCWMWVAHDKKRVFVRFKDYAFFVPRSGAEGRPVVFEGVVSKRILSVEEARHYAESTGDAEGAKRIHEPQAVPFVMASGVRMYRAPAQKPAPAETPAKKG